MEIMTHTDVVRGVLSDIADTQGRMLVYCALLRHSFALETSTSVSSA